MSAKFCAPNSTNSGYTCFTKEGLKTIVREYNKKYPHNRIPLNQRKKVLWTSIRDRIGELSSSYSEISWLQNHFLDSKDLKKFFRTKKPQEWKHDKTKWLSTIDINQVLKQYEWNSDYCFIGAVPIDFNTRLSIGICVIDELCNLNLQRLYLNGYRKLGIVFNMDPHDQPGSHWVSLFANLNNGGIYYFDSYGKCPPRQIEHLMERIRKMGNELLVKNIITPEIFESTHCASFDYESVDSNMLIVNSETCLATGALNYIDVKDSSGTLQRYQFSIKNSLKIRGKQLVRISHPVPPSSGKLIQCGFVKLYNNIRFQYKFSECGVYSIYFQTQLLCGKSFHDVITNIIDDDTINKQRDFFYRTNE